MEQYRVFCKELTVVAIDLTVAACKRFGAADAELAISACADGLRAGHRGDELIAHVLFETSNKIRMTNDDIRFVRDLMAAGRELNRGIGSLRFLVQAENKKREVVDVG